MTIRVRIEHAQPGYDKAITVEEMTVDALGDLTHRDSPGYKHVVQPGQSIELYVYSAQSLVVTEGPAARKDDPAK